MECGLTRHNVNGFGETDDHVLPSPSSCLRNPISGKFIPARNEIPDRKAAVGRYSLGASTRSVPEVSTPRR